MAKRKGPRDEAYEQAAREFEEFMKQAYNEPINYKYSHPVVNVLFWVISVIGVIYFCKGIVWLIEYINYKNPMGF